MDSKKFGLLSYTATANLGDEMQSLAARRFLPRVDRLIDRERLHQLRSDDGAPYWTIMNGWFCHHAENWPPSPALRPLILSVHISPDPAKAGGVGLRPADILLSQSLKKYLQGWGPIGARDKPTLRRLQNAGVPGFFSGCLTLTLPRPDVPRDDDLIVVNDVPRELVEELRKKTKKRIVATTHWNDKTTDPAERFLLAEKLLQTYAGASCVITPRLHCALPCTAIGTPVLLLDTATDQHRFEGLNDFVRHCTLAQYFSGESGFDVNAPTPNPSLHVPVAQKLEERVRSFIESPEQGVAEYPLSPADIQDGLRLINQRTLDLLYAERRARINLEAVLASTARTVQNLENAVV
jgi:hypothetical protein